MGSYLTSRPFLRGAAVVFVVMLAAAVAVIQSRRGEDPTIFAPLGPGEADTLVSELARCRMITSDDTAGLDVCRRIWAENRQHFFVSTESNQLPPPPVLGAPAGLPKSHDQGPPHEVDHGRIP
jgi:conjugative transfer region protein TrbK